MGSLENDSDSSQSGMIKSEAAMQAANASMTFALNHNPATSSSHNGTVTLNTGMQGLVTSGMSGTTVALVTSSSGAPGTKTIVVVPVSATAGGEVPAKRLKSL